MHHFAAHWHSAASHWDFLVAFFTSRPWLHPANWHQLRAEAIRAYPHLWWLRHWHHWRELFAFLRLVGGRGA